MLEAESRPVGILSLPEPMTSERDRPEISVVRDDPVGETARALIEALCAEMSARYGTPPSPFSVSQEAAVFLVAYLGGQPVGCGALRRLNDNVAEVKRMYVAPVGRRKGIARTILVELERHARRLGYESICLETGVLQPEAQQLYTSCGFTRIPAFGPYVGNSTSVCFEKHFGKGQ